MANDDELTPLLNTTASTGRQAATTIMHSQPGSFDPLSVPRVPQFKCPIS
jgi:hypothetical protein